MGFNLQNMHKCSKNVVVCSYYMLYNRHVLPTNPLFCLARFIDVKDGDDFSPLVACIESSSTMKTKQ